MQANSPSSTTPRQGLLPAHYQKFHAQYPVLMEAFEKLGEISSEAGPLRDKTRALVKLGIAIGGQMEGAVHSHTRRCLEAGCTDDEIRHAVILSITTLGFPSMMKTLSWVEDVLGKKVKDNK